MAERIIHVDEISVVGDELVVYAAASDGEQRPAGVWGFKKGDRTKLLTSGSIFVFRKAAGGVSYQTTQMDGEELLTGDDIKAAYAE